MVVFFLGLLFVMIIPLAEGALFALFLREVYIRHPLLLGGAIVPEWWKSPPPPAPPESADVQEVPVESDEPVESVSVEAPDAESGLDVPPAEVPPPVGISHFDGATNIPKDLPVYDTLETMTSGTVADVPPEFERIIGESATAENAHAIEDNLDQDDLQALANALPEQAIDFSREIEEDSHASEPISPTAKEVLGDNFDFQALEQQIKESTESRQQTAEKSELPLPAPSVDSATYPTEMTLDVQEDESGTVQVSSSFMLNAASQFASNFAEPQTVFPTFSNDLLHEPSSTTESMTGEIAQFFFSEESRPMFTRKAKKQPAAG